MIGIASLFLAGVFVLGTIGVIGRGPAALSRPAPIPSDAPAVAQAPTVTVEPRPETTAPDLAIDAGPQAPSTRAQSRPIQARERNF
jgi:hypothetical protein